MAKKNDFMKISGDGVDELILDDYTPAMRKVILQAIREGNNPGVFPYNIHGSTLNGSFRHKDTPPVKVMSRKLNKSLAQAQSSKQLSTAGVWADNASSNSRLKEI